MYGRQTYRRGCATAVALALLPLVADHAHAIDVQAVMSNPAVKTAMASCQADRNAFCSTVVPGGGRIVRCLAQHQEKLSPQCVADMVTARDSLISAGLIDPSAFKK